MHGILKSFKRGDEADPCLRLYCADHELCPVTLYESEFLTFQTL